MAQAVVKGVVALTIDELELEASLSFTPDPNGAEWSAEKLQRLAMDARLSGFSQKRAEEILAKFARAKGPVKELVAQGQAPEPARPEEPEWAQLAVPPELVVLVDASLHEAAEPELYRIRVETIRSEKIVTKRAALPFLPPKKEKVAVSEKREVRERTYPDLTLVKTGYARKGERLAILAPAQAGKPGKNIYGRPLPPSGGDEDPAFITGRGIDRRKNELYAEYDGVLRAGTRWAELIPLGAHVFSVNRSSDGATYSLSYEPGDPRLPAPTPAAILAEALRLGAPEGSLIAEAELAAMLAEAQAARRALCAPLSLDRDGHAEVRVSPDRLRATLSVWKGRGRGAPLSLAAVSAALKAPLLCEPGANAACAEAAPPLRGLELERIKRDILEFYKSDRDVLLDYVLVEGKAPLRGKDRVVKLSAAFLPDEEVERLRARLCEHPDLAGLDRIDEFPLDEAVRLAFVKAGQRIGELSAASAGQPGLDIYGTEIPGIPGNDPDIKVYDAVEFARGVLSATRDGLLAFAEKDGHLRFRVIPYRDAAAEVEIAPDGMCAFLSLRPEEGLGAPLSVELALAALQAKGVVQGLDARAVVAAVAAARAGEEVRRRPVAFGKSPVPAGGIRLVWLLASSLPAGSPLALRLGPGGQPPARGFRVVAGQELLRVERAGGAGEEGRTVLGQAVMAPPSADDDPATDAGRAAAAAAGAAPPLHDATIRVEEGPPSPEAPGGVSTFVAATAGELIFEGGRLAVRDRLSLPGDLSPESGELKFPGQVQVQGSVLAGARLLAGGDVAIGGSVEAALVSSEGLVALGGGVKGAKRGTVRARRSIDAAFAEQALLLAVEDIRVRTSCVLCNVKTNGRLLVAGDKGALVGGIVRARRGVEAAQIGSEQGVKTEISFGQDYLIADMIDAETREIERLKTLVLEADRAMAGLERAGGGSGLDRVRQDKVKLIKLIEKRSIRLFDLREKFEAHHPSEVRVRGTIYPGVILESHNRFLEVRSRKSRVAFSFDPSTGRIVERPL